MDFSTTISLITLGIIAWYTIETMILRQINSKLLKIETEKKEPCIEAFFDNGNTFYSIVLNIRNVGGSPAKNIKITLHPQLDLGEKVINDYFNKNAVFQDGLAFLPAGSEYKISAGYTQVASDSYKNGDLPRDYTITLDYENLSGQKRSSSIGYNLDHFFYRVNPQDKTAIEEQINKLNENSEKLIKAVESLNKRESEHIVFHTNQSFNVESQILQFEFLEGTLFAENINNESILWQIELQCYITPLMDIRTIIPYYHCKAFLNPFTNVSFDKRSNVDQFPIHFVPPYQTFYRSKTLYATNSELIIDGPGYITLVVWTASKVFEINDTPVVTADIVLKTINSDIPINLKAQFQSRSPIRGKTCEWILRTENRNT